MDKWGLVHSYRRMVEAGILEPLLCPDHDEPIQLMITIGPHDEPQWICFECMGRYRPGTDFYDQIKEVAEK